MPEQRIEAHKITKPIQLLAAWLVGLILVNCSLLAAAKLLNTPSWAPSVLTIAAIVNVPVFLICIFLLQTRFRPEMQEDTYYSKYLEKKISPLTGKENYEQMLDVLRNDLIDSNKIAISLLSDLNNKFKIILEHNAHFDYKNINFEGEKEYNKQIIFTKKNIDYPEEAINWQTCYVEINDLLPNYANLRTKLKNAGVIIKNVFGSSSIKPEIPKYNILSFGNDVTIDHLRALIPILLEFKFEYIHFTEEDINQGRIYIGSYIYRLHGEWFIKRLNDEFVKFILDKETNIDSLINRFYESIR